MTKLQIRAAILYRRRIPAGWNVGMLLWLKHNHIKVWVGTYKQQPYPYRSSATKFQSNFHIWEPFHWCKAIPEHFKTIRTDTAPIQPFWGDSDLFEILGFHSRHFPFDSINFQPFQIDWNTGVSFIKDSSRFDHVLSHFACILLLWVVLRWIQCVLFHSEPNCIHSICFCVVDLLSSYFRLMGANSYCFESIPDVWAKAKAKILIY